MRYVVSEVEGWLRLGENRGGGRTPGLSVQVLDTMICYRVMASWRTEDYGGSVDRRRTLVRHRAATRCAELNGVEPPPRLPTSKFRPACPRCGRLCDPDAAYCKCGKNLYRQELGH